VNRIVTTLLDGRTVAKGVTVHNCLVATIYVTVTIPNLNFIEEILNVQVHSSDAAYGCPIVGTKHISGNTVGITICSLNAGVTAIIEAIAIGV
ncbi:unnamed protein product, partial [marine sediment metagenome]